MPEVKIKRLHPKAKVPTVAHKDDACFDLYASEDTYISNQPRGVNTGWAFEIPPGYFLELRPRSGLSREGVVIANSPGTVDSGYRGEIKVLLAVPGLKNVKLIQAGERIAQCRLVKRINLDFVEVDGLSESERGERGFGSTGK